MFAGNGEYANLAALKSVFFLAEKTMYFISVLTIHSWN